MAEDYLVVHLRLICLHKSKQNDRSLEHEGLRMCRRKKAPILRLQWSNLIPVEIRGIA